MTREKLAKLREAVAAMTEHPWRVLTDEENYAGETDTPRSLALMTDPPGSYPEEIIAEVWDGDHPGDANAAGLVALVNAAPELLDLAERALAKRTLPRDDDEADVRLFPK